MKLLLSAAVLLLFNLSMIAQEKSWKCIDTKGQEVFSIKAKWAYGFTSDLAKIKKYRLVDKKWVSAYGFINRKGEIVIPCIYEEADDFHTTVTWVRERGSETYLLIDKKGNVVPTKPYKKVGIIVPGYCDRLAVYENKKLGFIDLKGQEIAECKYLGSSIFYEGLACVALYNDNAGKYGFIDTMGRVAIPLQYKQGGTSSFNNGLSRAKVDGKTVLIDKQGNVKFKTKYRSFQGMRMNRGAICTKADRKGWGFVNWKDELVIGGDYDFVKSFGPDGYAVVEKNGLQGLIDTLGNFVLPMKYGTIYSDFSKTGYYCAAYPSDVPQPLMNQKKDYFLKGLKPLAMDVKYLGTGNGTDIIKFCNSDGLVGFMDQNENIIIEANYKKVEEFENGLSWVRP